MSVFILGYTTSCSPSNKTQNNLIIAQAAEPRSLDPQVATGNNDFRIAAQIFEGLVRFQEGSLKVEPALAVSWEVSANATVYRFTLREDVHFHDNTPLDAEAVKFNFERMLNPDHPYYDTGPFPLNFFFSVIDEIVIINSYTIEFKLSQPFAPFLSNLAYPTGFISSPTAIKNAPDTYGRSPVGTGPYQFVDWQSQRRVKLQAWANYWGEEAHIKTIYFKPIADENTRLTELLSGGCDVVMEVPADIISYFRKKEAYEVIEAAGPHLWFLILNTAEGPLKDVRVRQAVNLAINKESMVTNLLQGTATIANGPIAEAFDWAYDESLDPWPYDPESARKLIEDANATGKELTFLVTESGSGMLEPKSMATAIQADLNAVGLNVTIETYEWNTYLSKVNGGLKGQADIAQMAWMTNDPDTLPYLTLHSNALPEKGGFNSGYYQNAVVDNLLEKARAESDLSRRAELYKQIQQIVHEEAPWAFIASWKQNAVISENVANFKLHPSFLFDLSEVKKNSLEGNQ